MFHHQHYKTVFAFLVLMIVANHHADLDVSGQEMVPPLLVGSQFVVMIMVVLSNEIDGTIEIDIHHWYRYCIGSGGGCSGTCFAFKFIIPQVAAFFH